ncbi:helix-turn-helix domain-containing protein [Bacillaceae bacterium S4-13-56]
MDNREKIGKQIKDLRNFFNITQKELCEGICTQAYISKVENGSIAISSDLLYQIADRLGIDINYLYDSSSISRIDYVEEVLIQARELVDSQNYQGLYYLIKSEAKSPLVSNKRFKQFILWHQSICERHINNNHSKAIELIEEALSLSSTSRKTKSEREIEILISKANLFLELEQYQKALIIYKDSHDSLIKLPIHNNIKLQPRLYYNWARAHYLESSYTESIAICKRGISYCQKKQIMYGLGQLYFLLGRCLTETKSINEALHNFNYAKTIFQITDKKIQLEKVEEQLIQLRTVKNN